MKALRDYVVLKQRTETKTSSGIYLNTNKTPKCSGEVIAIGNSVKDVQVGQNVICDINKAYKLSVSDPDFPVNDGEIVFITKEEDIMAILD